MELNEIKKALYKQNPKAEFNYIVKGVMVYDTFLGEEKKRIVFAVPVSDIGDATFTSEMDAKYLIRYLTTAKNIVDEWNKQQS